MKKSLGAKPLLSPAPVWIIGSYDKDLKPNIMAASWCGICCSSPPCMSVSLRKATYTYHNIVHHKAFTVNIPSVDFIKESDFCGIESGKNTDKFKKTGLTPVKSTVVNAPYVKEFPLFAECKLVNQTVLGLHTMFVGEILDVKAEEKVLGTDGMPAADKLKTFAYDPGQSSYNTIGLLLRKAFSASYD